MRVPTVTLRHKSSGQVIVVNENDYANGSLPGAPEVCINGSDWERVSETGGDAGAAEVAAADSDLARLLEGRDKVQTQDVTAEAGEQPTPVTADEE